MLSAFENFLSENAINSVGRLCVLLYVADRLIDLPRPHSIDLMLTDKRTQIKGLNGKRVGQIMAACGKPIPDGSLGEAGRTSRGSIQIAKIFVDWLNAAFSEDEIRIVLLHERDYLVDRIYQLFGQKNCILASIPTLDAGYLGPHFEFTEGGLTLSETVENAEALSPELVESLSHMVSSFCDDLATSGNCYHRLRDALARYKSEITRDVTLIRIPIIYTVGLQIENLQNALNKDGSEDPPLEPSRAAGLASLLAINGVLVASTDAGRRMLDAAAFYNSSQVDLEGFKQVATTLASEAREQKFMDETASEFVRSTAAAAGEGSTPARTAHVGLLTSRNAWSVIIQSVVSCLLGEFAKNSEIGREVISNGAQLIDLASAFLRNNSQIFVSLSVFAPEFFGWAPRIIDWINSKLSE